MVWVLRLFCTSSGSRGCGRGLKCSCHLYPLSSLHWLRGLASTELTLMPNRESGEILEFFTTALSRELTREDKWCWDNTRLFIFILHSRITYVLYSRETNWAIASDHWVEIFADCLLLWALHCIARHCWSCVLLV